MSVYNFDEINDLTGFANGDKFDTEEEVFTYFNMVNLREMFPDIEELPAKLLKQMAEIVIKNKWHCNF